MIIKLSNYDGKCRVVSLAKSETALDVLVSMKLPIMVLDGDRLHFLPEDVIINLTEIEHHLLEDSCDYDVFQISDTGNAYKYYDNKSLDNAVLVTNRCNSNCIMCPTAEIIRKGHEEYTADELIEIISHFPSDAPHITITGGEPFLIKKDLFRVLKFLKEKLPETEYLLLTNGRAFCMKDYAELYKQTAPYNTLIGIPVHGYNSETHDYIVQAKGAFDQTIFGIKHLLAVGAKIEIRIVVSRLNADFITDIAKLVIDKFQGVQCVKIIGLEMTGNAAKNAEHVWIDYPTAFKCSRDAVDSLITAGIDTALYNFPLCAVNKKYRNICAKSISGYKVRFAPECDECILKDACGGIFSGTIRLAKSTVKPIQE